jgi:hypothetical protein
VGKLGPSHGRVREQHVPLRRLLATNRQRAPVVCHGLVGLREENNGETKGVCGGWGVSEVFGDRERDMGARISMRAEVGVATDRPGAQGLHSEELLALCKIANECLSAKTTSGYPCGRWIFVGCV